MPVTEKNISMLTTIEKFFILLSVMFFRINKIVKNRMEYMKLFRAIANIQ